MRAINPNAPKFKKIHTGEPATRALLAGVSALAAAVGSTMGPRGLNVSLEGPAGMPPLNTNDGVTVAKHIDLEDPIENMACQMLKEAAERTNEYAGDGTTTATVLGAKLLTEGLRHAAVGANPVLLKKALDKVTKLAVAELARLAVPVRDPADIRNIATISSQNPQVGEVLGELYARMNMQAGAVTLEEDASNVGVTGHFMEGLTWEGGLYSQAFFTDGIKGECTLEDLPVLLLDLANVADPMALVPFMKELVRPAAETGQPSIDRLLVVAKSFGPAPISVAVQNNFAPGGFKTIAVKSNAFGESGAEFLRDLAALTGATIVNEESGITLKSLNRSHLGHVRKVISNMYRTTLLGDSEPAVKERVAARVAAIDEALKAARNEDARNRILDRRARLTTGVGVVKVGAVSELEGTELRLRVEDAINACHSALREGVVTGGGSALVHVANVLRFKDPEAWGLKTREGRAAFDIMLSVLEAPARQIALNAGANPDTVVEKIYEQFENPGFGFNALTCTFEDIAAAGVLDPALVTRAALENAVSVVGTLLTTGVTVTNSKEKISDSLPKQ